MGANELLVIPNNAGDSLGYLLLYIAIVFVFVTVISITYKRVRISKLRRYVEETEHLKQINDTRKEKLKSKKR